jgi:UDP-N-acetylmuramyl tripeptide synthase
MSISPASSGADEATRPHRGIATRARYATAIAVGRGVRTVARIRKRGGGTAMPGVVANRVAPGLLADAINGFPDGLVIVSGSAGKSTTTKMLATLLEQHGKTVFTNGSTANIAQGLMSAILDKADLSGRIPADIAVLEMDEGHGAKIAPALDPHTVVLTNVVIDQIDRFDDPRKVTMMLEKIARRATKHVVSNGDDASLEEITKRIVAPVVRFGVSHNVVDEAPHGLGYLATTEKRMSTGTGTGTGTGTIVEHSNGSTAVLVHNGVRVHVTLPARGVHFAVDAAGAIAAASVILGEAFDLDLAVSVLSEIPPVFGRGEVLTIQGKKVEFVLIQNPSSFQLNIDELPSDLDQVLVAMGSDVRDPSYLWPVDTSSLGAVNLVSGSIADEVALQLEYRGVHVGRVEPDLDRALDDFIALPEPASGVKTIVFSADSMRRTRSHWGLV